MIGKSGFYRIQVEGRLDAICPDWHENMSITTDRSDEEKPLTKIEGRLKDQSALSGVLSTLYKLRLPVLSVECFLDS